MTAETENELTDFSYFETSTYGMCMVGSKKTIHLFENEPLQDPLVTSNFLPVDCLFQPQSCSFLTAAGAGVKLWDARSGLLVKEWEDLDTKGEVRGFEERSDSKIIIPHSYITNNLRLAPRSSPHPLIAGSEIRFRRRRRG
jgi:hypothetical protein